MAPPDCWANGVAIRCFKCRKALGNQNWCLCNVAPDAASGGTMMPFHRDCAPVVFSGPTFGPSAAEVAALRKDAERFRYLQNIPVVQAQQYFWNHQSRKQRAEAIDFDMKQNVPVIDRAQESK